MKSFVSASTSLAEPPPAAANAAPQDNQKKESQGVMINRGSEWHRWEPHIHAPGTLFNNEFKGPNAWRDYLISLEQATPVRVWMSAAFSAMRILLVSASIIRVMR